MIINRFQNSEAVKPLDLSNMRVAQGFDSAIIGVTAPGPNTESVVIYDYEACIHILMEREGWSWGEAIDFLDYNVVGSFVGPEMPIFIHMGTPEE